jgi:hypothetical protein
VLPRRVSICSGATGLADAALGGVFPIIDGRLPLASYPTRRARAQSPPPKSSVGAQDTPCASPREEPMLSERLTSLIHDQLETDLYGANQTGHTHGPHCECKPSKETHALSFRAALRRAISAS